VYETRVAVVKISWPQRFYSSTRWIWRRWLLLHRRNGFRKLAKSCNFLRNSAEI